MTLLSTDAIKTAGGLALLATLAVSAIWIFGRRRLTDEEIEQARRRFLAHSGRLVDGMLLDICEMEAEDGRALTLLVYSYRIGGVDYQCSQDVTGLSEVMGKEVRVGLPCSVRYQPGSPQNSLVVAETWSGLRGNLADLPLSGPARSTEVAAQQKPPLQP